MNCVISLKESFSELFWKSKLWNLLNDQNDVRMMFVEYVSLRIRLGRIYLEVSMVKGYSADSQMRLSLTVGKIWVIACCVCNDVKCCLLCFEKHRLPKKGGMWSFLKVSFCGV